MHPYNFYLLIIIFPLICLFKICCATNDDKDRVEEFCFWEIFKPECSNKDVLMINYAKYGRMNIGKCLTEQEMQAFGSQSQDPRFLGCHNKVTDILNKKCALNRTCEVKIIDLEKTENTACLPGMKMYLEVEYTCLSVVEFDESCHIFATSRAKYLNPNSFKNIVCGSRGRPLKIEAPKGQKVKITHERFSQDETNREDIEGNTCDPEIAVISDKQQGRNSTVCLNGIRQQRDQFKMTKVFLSKESHISVVFYHEEIKSLFLLKIEAEGCLDIIPPEDTWSKRNGDDIVIGCYSSKQTWYLRCESRQWIGAIGNCSIPDSEPSDKLKNFDSDVEHHKLNISSTQQILIVTTICGFGLVVCLAIICIGALCLKRLRSKDLKNLTYYNVAPANYNNATYNQRNQKLQSYHQHDNKTINNGYLSSNSDHPGPIYLQGNTDEDRYQILDKDEVVKESFVKNV